jgi:hypothetical protein
MTAWIPCAGGDPPLLVPLLEPPLLVPVLVPPVEPPLLDPLLVPVVEPPLLELPLVPAVEPLLLVPPVEPLLVVPPVDAPVPVPLDDARPVPLEEPLVPPSARAVASELELPHAARSRVGERRAASTTAERSMAAWFHGLWKIR